MFKFLKERLKRIISKTSTEIEKEVEKEEKVEEKKEEVKKTNFLEKITKKISLTQISEKKFDELFEQFELVLLENNVAVEVIEKIKKDLKQNLSDMPLGKKAIENKIRESLRGSIESLFSTKKIDLFSKINENKPYVILFLGVNGGGKTTTIAKFVNLFQKHNLACILAAADTFRAASIEQLQEHADKLNVRLIKHDYKSDPAAVAFDAVKYAKSKNVDIVLIDTAGRMHSNQNLMEEIKKIIRVVKPHLKIFVGESIVGNDCIEQARKFDEFVDIDGIVLSKVDVDEKGGTAISISYAIGKPIIYLGTGQSYEDLIEFNVQNIIKKLNL